MLHLSRRHRWKAALVTSALPLWIAADASQCPTGLSGTIFGRTITYSESYDACASCNEVRYTEFEDPTNPEDTVVVTFEATSADALDAGDVYAELQLTCGHGVGGAQTFPVTFQAAGLTTLTGRFEGNARSLCVPGSGQRSPGLWTVFVQRVVAQQDVTFTWTVSYKEYADQLN
ncbi:MAG: hypothetical protein DCC65_12440 [Planctomycetota bacterium]|nr:MAG: hypothetical protein DCC65_12440 [Planctomycetota bacterium]